MHKQRYILANRTLYAFNQRNLPTLPILSKLTETVFEQLAFEELNDLPLALKRHVEQLIHAPRITYKPKCPAIVNNPELFMLKEFEGKMVPEQWKSLLNALFKHSTQQLKNGEMPSVTVKELIKLAE